MDYVKKFQNEYNILNNLVDKPATVNELKSIILKQVLNLPHLSSFSFQFAQEKELLTTYTDDAYVAFLAKILYEMRQKGVY